MTEPLISVIVPVYKVEDYLIKCVDSIRNQTYQNLEILLVDDGSPDGCGQMCDELALQDNRIKVIHKANGGLSSARNAGLDAMTGAYVGFVDSDDWIDPQMYEALLSQMEKHGAKMGVGGIAMEFPGRTQSWNPCAKEQDPIRVLSRLEALQEVTRQLVISNSVCDKLFAAELFKDIRMTEGIIHEDMEIMHLLLEQSEQVVYVPRLFYHYLMREESITHGACTPRKFTMTDMTRKRMEYYKATHKDAYAHSVCGHIIACLELIWMSAGVADCKALRKTLISEVRALSNPQVKALMAKKDQIRLLLCKCSPYLFSQLMKLYHR